MKVFEAKGTFNLKGEKKAFSKRVKAENENAAREKILCLIGGKQKIPRRFIEINTVGEEKQ